MTRIRVVPALAVLALACTYGPAPGRSAGTPPSVAQRKPVPALPPDGWLDEKALEEIFADSNIVREHPKMTGPYPRDLIALWFKDDASQADRQAAVDLVGGEVVGGARLRPGGVYYVRIRHDGTADPLHAAIAKLKALPQVRQAGPDLRLVFSPPVR